MGVLTNFELISFWAGVMSLCLGFISFVASLFFYDKARLSEIENSKILTEINQSTDTLRTINNSLLQKTIGHIADSNVQLINGLIPLTRDNPITEEMIDDVTKTLLLSSYTLKTNFLAKSCYVMVSGEKTKSSLQKLINISQEDYSQIKQDISKLTDSDIKNSPVYEDYLANKKMFEFLINLKVDI